MKFNGYYTLSAKPKIVSFWAGNIDDYACKNFKKAYCVVFSPWHLELAQYQELAARYSNAGLSFIFACNDQLTATRLRLANIPNFVCSSNCYVSEHVFKIEKVPKIYDAVYIAQMKSYKRIELMSQLSNSYVITYKEGTNDYDLSTFCPEVKCEYNKHWIPQEQVAKIINQSHVGLALSAVEGAMLGCVQYLLCGIPIISTRSVGGRERFFDNYHTTVVSGDSDEIANIVAALKNNHFDPNLIRQVTLDRMWVDRQQLINLLVYRTGEEEAVIAQRLFGQGIEANFTLVPSKPA